MEEWMKSYIYGLDNPGVHTIGLSKIALPHCRFKAKNDKLIARSRKLTLEALDKLDLIKKPLHLLGAETPLEFNSHPVYSKVRSTDSCFSIWSAMNNQDWTLDKESIEARIPTPHDYFTRDLTKDQIAIAKSNIKFLENVVSSI
jgi:hypothetical protein